MKQTIDPGELIHRFNEDEAVWRRYTHKRELLRRLGSPLPLAEAVHESLDWLEAEAECRQTRCIGKMTP